MIETAPRARCAKRVFSGARHDMGGHKCPNYAAPGDTLCGQHRAAEERAAAQPADREATAPPTLTVQRTTRVHLAWPVGAGPIFRRKYGARDLVWSWIAVRVEHPWTEEKLDRLARIDGLAHVLKKDGTSGAVQERPDFISWRDLPEHVRLLLLTELRKADQ